MSTISIVSPVYIVRYNSSKESVKVVLLPE